MNLNENEDWSEREAEELACNPETESASDHTIEPARDPDTESSADIVTEPSSAPATEPPVTFGDDDLSSDAASGVLIELVTNRQLEGYFRREIGWALEGLPIEAKAFRFQESLDLFFGSRRFGFMFICHLLDRLLPHQSEFLAAFVTLCAEVLQDSFRPCHVLLAENAATQSMNQLLYLHLPPRREVAWSAMLASLRAYAPSQADHPREQCKTGHASSLSGQALVSLLQSKQYDWQEWVLQRLYQSPAGTEFTRRLHRQLSGFEQFVRQELNATPEPSLEDVPLPDPQAVSPQQWERAVQERENEKWVRRKAAQETVYHHYWQSLFGPKQVARNGIRQLIQALCPEEETARQCCADVILWVVGCGLLEAWNPLSC